MAHRGRHVEASEGFFKRKNKPRHGSHSINATQSAPKESSEEARNEYGKEAINETGREASKGSHRESRSEARKGSRRESRSESRKKYTQPKTPQGISHDSTDGTSSSNLSNLVESASQSGIPDIPSPFETTMGDLIEISDDAPLTRRELRVQRERRKLGRASRLAPLMAFSEITLAAALVIALYVVWMVGWTGIIASRSQEEQFNNSGWEVPVSDSHAKIAPAQAGDPPVQPTYANEGDLIGQLYLPSVWGVEWQRNIVQGTSLRELNLHGYGHYDDTQMPGELGNFAIAGHTGGYGDPGGRNSDLKTGDAIIVRTQDYWYIYKMTGADKVLPNATEVIAPVPNNVNEQPASRYITLTTCWPKYRQPTHRYIVWGELSYWAKVSDGIPKELYSSKSIGSFSQVAPAEHFEESFSRVAKRVPNLNVVCIVSLLVFAVIYIAASIVWGRPDIKKKGTGSICGFIWRHLPGIKPLRAVLMILLLVIIISALFEWVYPWSSANIPYLQEMSSFTIEEAEF